MHFSATALVGLQRIVKKDISRVFGMEPFTPYTSGRCKIDHTTEGAARQSSNILSTDVPSIDATGCSQRERRS